MLLEFLMTLIIVLIIFAALVVFVTQQATGILIEKQILAKEICLLATEARQRTTVMVEHDKAIFIEKKDSGIIVKKGQSDSGYFYPCYLNGAEFSRKDDITIIEIK